MRNIKRALIFHVLVIIFVFCFSLLINLSKSISNIIYSNIVFKILLSLIPISLYFNLGKGMNKNTSKKLDFCTGMGIFLVAVILELFAFVGLGENLYKMAFATSLWKFPVDLFLMPFMYIFEMFKVKNGIWSFLIASLSPTIIFGISMKISRKKIKEVERKKRMAERRKRRAEARH